MPGMALVAEATIRQGARSQQGTPTAPGACDLLLDLAIVSCATSELEVPHDC
jgi:hypothetical protein